MSANPEPIDSELLEQKRREIQMLVEEIRRLSDSQVGPADFYPEFMRRVLQAIAAPAGALWGRTAQGNLQLQFQINFHEVGLDQVENARECHDELLRQSIQQGRPRVVPPRSGPPVAGEPVPANLTNYFVIIVPILVEKQVAGLIEVWQEPDRNANAIRGFVNFLVEMAALAASYLQKSQLRQMIGRQQLWTQLEAFARQVHGSLNTREVAYLIVNEGRRLIECDRVSVGVRQGSWTAVEAISGADVIEKRSSLVQAMRHLLDQVILWGEKLVYVGVKDDSLPPKVLHALDEYLAESNSKMLIVMPMQDEREKDEKAKKPRPCRSALMVECFEPTASVEQMSGRMEVIVRHAAPALYNAVEYRRLPFRWLLAPLANVKDTFRGNRLAIVGGVAAGLVLVAALMAVVPWPLRMDAKGHILPRERQTVYARIEGPITKVKLDNNDPVAKDEELLTIQDLGLQRRIAEAENRMTAAGELARLYQERASRATEDAEKLDLKTKQIAAEFDFKKARVERDLLMEQSRNPREAIVRSPMTGTVVTFNTRERLEGKPVRPGDPLLQVARLDGEWEIELKIPERHVGHVRRALAESPKGYLDVDIRLASHPTQQYKGRLYRDGLAGEVTLQETESVLTARVEILDISREDLDRMPVGAEVKAKIRCGNASVGYAWFYELWEFCHEHILFRIPWVGE